MRVLDIGSAGGGTLFPALDRLGEAGSIVGIEIDEEWVEELRTKIANRGLRNAENLQMDGRSMRFGDGVFDAVIMGMVGLDSDYDVEADRIVPGAPLMSEVLRVLKPGCFLYSSNWLRQQDSDWMRELIRRHLPDYTKHGYFPALPEGVAALLTGVGFEDIRITFFEGHYTFDDPAEWMAGLSHVWPNELERIKGSPRLRRSFEGGAFELLATHLDDLGRIAYTRSAFLVAARKPVQSPGDPRR